MAWHGMLLYKRLSLWFPQILEWSSSFMKTNLQSSPCKCYGGQQLLEGKPSAFQFGWPGLRG